MQPIQYFLITYSFFGVCIWGCMLYSYIRQQSSVKTALIIILASFVIILWPVFFFIIFYRKTASKPILKDEKMPDECVERIQKLADEGHTFFQRKIRTPLPPRVCRAEILYTEDYKIVCIRINGDYSIITRNRNGGFRDRWNNTYQVMNRELVMTEMPEKEKWIGKTPDQEGDL